jgi:hypothetical protein
MRQGVALVRHQLDRFRENGFGSDRGLELIDDLLIHRDAFFVLRS